MALLGGEPAAKTAELAQVLVARCEAASIDCESDAGGDRYGGGDIDTGNIGAVWIAEGTARLGQQDEPTESVLACRQGPECEVARAPPDAQAAISARPRTDQSFGDQCGLDDRELRCAGGLLREDEPDKDLRRELVGRREPRSAEVSTGSAVTRSLYGPRSG